MNTLQQICLDIAMSIDYCCVKGFPAYMLYNLDRLTSPYACSTLRYYLSAVQLSLLLRLMPSAATACTAAVKSLHPNICIAVHCSIPLHPQLPRYHESGHHWASRDQV